MAQQLKVFALSLPLVWAVSCRDSSTFKSGATLDSEATRDALANGGFNVKLTGTKQADLVELDIDFDDPVVDFDDSDLLVDNASITLFEGSESHFRVILKALVVGQVKVKVPANAAKHAIFRIGNRQSNEVVIDISEFDIDASLRLSDMKVEKRDATEPAKLVLIVDDSSSMTDKQELLSKSLSSSLVALKGKDVRVYLYTTTLVGAKTIETQNALMTRPGVGLFSNYTGSYATGNGRKLPGKYFADYIANPGTNFNGSKAPALRRLTKFIKGGTATAFTPATLFAHDSVEETYVIGPSAFTSKTIQLSKTSSEQEFSDAVTKIAAEVKSLGDKGASNAELPLCTLAAALMNEGPDAPFNKGDKAAFLILTDEDQSNLECLHGYNFAYKPKEFVNMWPDYYYQTTRINYEVKCDAGGTGFCTVRANGLALRTNCIEAGSLTCVPRGTKQACNATQQQEALAELSQSLKSQITAGTARLDGVDYKCEVQSELPSHAFGAPKVAALKVKDGTKCSDAPFVALGPDGKTPVTIQGTPLDEFKRLNPALDFTGTCYDEASSHDSVTTTATTFPGVKEAGSLGDFIHLKAKALFGPKNYLISLVGNLGADNPAGCSALTAFESKQVRAVADPAATLSICSPNYDKALGWFESFVKFEPQVKYQMEKGAVNVLAVTVLRAGGGEDKLAPGTFQFKDGWLLIDKGILSIGDNLKVKWR